MNTFHDLISKLYPEQASRIEAELNMESVSIGAPSEWYKNFNLFVTYADTFHSQGKANLDVLVNKLDYLADLGCTALHVLPPFQSPLVDGGFDISDYYTIRADLGGNQAFDTLIAKAHAAHIHVFLDLVCNHVSQEHAWFKQALAGETTYRNMFIHSEVMPKLLKKFTNDQGIWARYEIEGNEKDIRVIFSDQAGDIPHWIQGSDKYWYYHTFYPHQIDLEWNNPDVFIEFGKILKYWAKKGLNFRLDAIPFVGKDVPRGVTESTENTHLIVQALHQVMKQTSPESVFLVESCQPLEITKKYFGTKEIGESELAYNFHLMSALWSSLITADASHLATALNETKDIPKWGQWITFLRNHDDLSLEFPEEEIRQLLFNALKDKGLICKEGFGVGGQTIEFLGKDPKRFTMAYLLLASLPGCPALICGDEIGRPNDYGYMKEQTRLKQERFLHDTIVDDVRDLNRGYTTDEEASLPQSKTIYQTLATIFKTRLCFPELSTTIPTHESSAIPSVLSLQYTMSNDSLLVFINLKNEEVIIPCAEAGAIILAINGAKLSNTQVVLPPYAGIWIKLNKTSSTI